MPSELFPVYTALGLTFGLALGSWGKASESGSSGSKAAYALAGIVFFYSTAVAIMEIVVASSQKKSEA